MEDRRRRHLGLVFLRPAAQPDLLRLRQSLHLEPEAAAGRQQVVDDDLRPRSRYRHGEVGLSDDAARRVGLRRRQRDDPGRSEDRRARCASCWCISTATASATRSTATTGELLVAEKYDPAVNWATKVDMDKNSQNYGRPLVVAQVLDRAQRRGHQHQGHLPRRAGHQGRAAGGLLAGYRPVLRADQPRLHGLRAVPGLLHGGPALCRRDAVDVSRLRAATTWATSSPGMRAHGKIVWSDPEQFSVWSGALATRAASCSTARWKAI